MTEEIEGRRDFTRIEEEKTSRRFSDRIIVNRLYRYIKPYRNAVLALFIITVVHSIMHLIEPVMHMIVIDKIILALKFEEFYWWAPAFLGIAIIHFLAARNQQFLVSKIGNNITTDLRTDLTSHIQGISLRYFSEGETGRLMSRITNDVEVLTQFLAWRGAASSINNLTAIFGTIAILSLLNWRLLLATLAISFFAVGLLSVLGVFSRRMNRRIRVKMGGLTSNLQENITGMKIVKSFQREGEILSSFDQANNEYFDANMKAARIASIMEPAVDWVRALGVATILFFASLLVYSGQLTIGETVAFMEFTIEFYGPLRNLARIYDMYTSSMAASERIFALQDTTPEVTELPEESRIELAPFQKEIRFETVSFGYDPRTPVIKNLSLSIKRKEKIAIVGATGSGKSTLINLLCRFYDPEEGRITIDGVNIRDVSLKSLRRQMGIVLQDSFLFEDTILENIRYGKPDATDEQVFEASKAVNADKFIVSLPEAYGAKIEEGSSNISIGQRQLISFARTLLTNPRILILDEATSSVDPYTELYIQDALKKLLENRTAIIIAHRLSTVRMADEIIVLDKGNIVEQGTHQELMAKGGLYSAFYKTQFEETIGPIK
jgi:ABC-type multidrug transport system fused ATPase/permease subunit